MSNAAVYARLSVKQADKVRTVAEQERELRAEAKRRRLPVTHVFQDDGISAYEDKARPGFESLLDAVISQEVTHVLVAEWSRLARDEVVGAMFRAECRRAGVTIVAGGRDIDPDDDAGGLIAGIETWQAWRESRLKSKRVRAAMEIIRSKGGYLGGSRSLGYQNRNAEHPEVPKGALVVIAEEAEALRQGVELVLAGRGLRHVAKVWNAAGIRRPRGGAWDHGTVGRVLKNERIAGLYDGRRASWEAIISPEAFRDVCAALKARDSGARATKGRALLSGMLRCKECGAKIGRKRDGSSRPDRDYWLYMCRGCNRNNASAQRVDETVAEEFLAVVSDPKFVAKLLDTLEGDHAAELRSLLDEQHAAKERLQTFAEDYAAGLITRDEFLAGRRVAADRLETLTRDIDRASAAATFTVPPEEIIAKWDSADDELRRSWLATLVDHVVLHRATTSGPGNFDRARVEVVWRV